MCNTFANFLCYTLNESTEVQPSDIAYYLIVSVPLMTVMYAAKVGK